MILNFRRFIWVMNERWALHVVIKLKVFTALHGMQMRSSDWNSVRPSVCLSVKLVHYDKTEESGV